MSDQPTNQPMKNESERWWQTYTLRYGKHRGETMYMVYLNDYQYIEWLDNTMLGKGLRKVVDAAIKYHYETQKKED